MPHEKQDLRTTLTLGIDSRARLHDNVQADLLPRWQKVRQSRATLSPDALMYVPDWVSTSAVQPTFGDSDGFNKFEVPWSPVGTQQVQPRRRVGLRRCRAQPNARNAVSVGVSWGSSQTAIARKLWIVSLSTILLV